METLPEDKQIIELVSKLKDSSSAYPKDMLYARRQQFARQVASASVGVAANINQAAEHGTTATTVASKIIEIVLIAAIVIEAGVISFMYRQKIADFLKSMPETPSATIQQPDNNVSSPLIEILPTLTPPPTSETPLAISSPFDPSPPPKSQTNSNNTNNNGSNTTTEAAPVSTGNNGNHYGQTPKPEQTKDGSDSDKKKNNNN